MRKDNEKRMKRKPRVDRVDRPMSAAADDGEKERVASSRRKKKGEKGDRQGRRTTKDVVGEQSTTTRQRGDDVPAVPVFNLGEYRATALSPRLDVIKQGVERAHRNRQHQSERRPQKQTTVKRDEKLGSRKTLETKALLSGKTQFVKLKVDVVDADAGRTLSTASVAGWRSRHITVAYTADRPHCAQLLTSVARYCRLTAHQLCFLLFQINHSTTTHSLSSCFD